MIENVTALLLWVSLALGRNVDLGMGDHMNMAMIKDGFRIAEDKIYIAFDIAIVEILPRGNTRTAVGLA